MIRIKIYRNIRIAEGKACPYCNATMQRGDDRRLWPSRDHIRARSQGATLRGNKLICCQGCNTNKGSLSLWSWHAQLVRQGDPRARRVLEVIVALYPLMGPQAYAKAVGDRVKEEAWFP